MGCAYSAPAHAPASPREALHDKVATASPAPSTPPPAEECIQEEAYSREEAHISDVELLSDRPPVEVASISVKAPASEVAMAPAPAIAAAEVKPLPQKPLPPKPPPPKPSLSPIQHMIHHINAAVATANLPSEGSSSPSPPMHRPPSPPKIVQSLIGTDHALSVQPRRGDDPCILFRPVAGLMCGEHWSSVPVRALPALPDGTLPPRLYYRDDSIGRVVDADLNLMHAVLRHHGYEKTASLTDSNWAIWWHSGLLRREELPLLASLAPWQRVNKFPGAGVLTNKAQLWECVNAARWQFGATHFDYVPQTFVLPAELEAYEAYMRAEEREGKQSLWILKPASNSRGVGIFLHRAQAETHGWGGRGGIMTHQVESHVGVASRDVDPPYLLDGLKFDLRLYVLVTSVHPLVLYIYDEGLARFATEAYDLAQPLDRRCMHLTNYSLNKKASNFIANTDEAEDGVGSKWSLSALRVRLAAELGATRADDVWRAIDDLVVKTLVAAEPALVDAACASIPAAARGEPVRSCFQLFGFDVMLDAQGKPWLLEVNCDPALGTGSPLDLMIKSQMLTDALSLVGMPVPPADASNARAGDDEPGGPRDPLRRWAEQGGRRTSGSSGVGGGSASGDSRAQLIEQWAVHLVDAEYKRSRSGKWRRLLPCRDEAYRKWLAPERPLNALNFEVVGDEPPPAPAPSDEDLLA